jgi:hypothetical protein
MGNKLSWYSTETFDSHGGIPCHINLSNPSPLYFSFISLLLPCILLNFSFSLSLYIIIIYCATSFYCWFLYILCVANTSVWRDMFVLQIIDSRFSHAFLKIKHMSPYGEKAIIWKAKLV